MIKVYASKVYDKESDIYVYDVCPVAEQNDYQFDNE